MKKLLIGLLALGTISTYAKSIDHSIKIGSKIVALGKISQGNSELNNGVLLRNSFLSNFGTSCEINSSHLIQKGTLLEVDMVGKDGTIFASGIIDQDSNISVSISCDSNSSSSIKHNLDNYLYITNPKSDLSRIVQALKENGYFSACGLSLSSNDLKTLKQIVHLKTFEKVYNESCEVCLRTNLRYANNRAQFESDFLLEYYGVQVIKEKNSFQCN